MTAALEIEGLRVDGDAAVLLAIDTLAVDAGGLVVVTGGTNSGKTLLASVLGGRAEAGGVVRVCGRELRGGPAARRRQGLAVTIDDGGRLAGCTVREALRLAGAARAEAALDRFALLSRRAGLRAELLSGGEQQLLQVACAWCARPRVLVLDAPTTGLADDVAELVRQVARDAATDGAAVLWLDQSAGSAPAAAAWRLVGGVLSAAQEEESTSAPA